MTVIDTRTLFRRLLLLLSGFASCPALRPLGLTHFFGSTEECWFRVYSSVWALYG